MPLKIYILQNIIQKNVFDNVFFQKYKNFCVFFANQFENPSSAHYISIVVNAEFALYAVFN